MEQQKYLYLEDLTVGQTFTAGPYKVTEAEIIAFARQYDPQDFHTDPAKAKDTFFGELVASGWHTAALTMRMMAEGIPKMEGGMVGRTIEKLSWPRAVKPGDEITLTIEVLDFRPSGSNPKRGIVRTRNIVRNQKGEPVLEMEVVMFIPRKVKS